MDAIITTTKEDIEEVVAENAKNMEQSAKSNTGIRFNKYVTSVLQGAHNGKTIIFLGEEVDY